MRTYRPTYLPFSKSGLVASQLELYLLLILTVLVYACWTSARKIPLLESVVRTKRNELHFPLYGFFVSGESPLSRLSPFAIQHGF